MQLYHGLSPASRLYKKPSTAVLNDSMHVHICRQILTVIVIVQNYF